MSLLHLTTAPKADDFTPLQEHQEQTPDTFFDSNPVLHAKHSGLTLSARSDGLQEDNAFSKLSFERDGESDVLIKDIEIWVTSENLLIYQSSSNNGVAIPYPSIALHATMKWKQQTEALYMNISLNDAIHVIEDEVRILELTVLPSNYASLTPDTACIKEIFSAMNTCADLHPDPNEDDEGEEVEDETAPGATGWITAENMDEYMDENGNFKGTVVGWDGEEELGPGAGTVRPREDTDEGNTNGVDDAHGEGHEDKVQRTG